MKREHQHRVARAARRTTLGFVFAVVGIAALVVACGSDIGGTQPVTIGRYVTGTVVGVDSSGSAICLKPESGAEQLCGIPLQRPGAPRLSVGQFVGVATASISTGTAGSRIEALIVYVPPPEP